MRTAAVRVGSGGLLLCEGAMNTEAYLREKLTELYQTDPYIHINANLPRAHVELRNARVKLVGVYRHIFQVTEEKNGKTERYAFQYGDITTEIVKIAELNG